MNFKNKIGKKSTTVDEDILKLRNDVDRLRWDYNFKEKVLELWDKQIEDRFKDYSTSELCTIYSSYQSKRFKYDKIMNVLMRSWIWVIVLTLIETLLIVFVLLFGLQDNYNWTIIESLFVFLALGYIILVPLTSAIDKLRPNDMKYALVGRCLINRLGAVKSMRIMSIKEQDYFARYLVNYSVDAIKKDGKL